MKNLMSIITKYGFEFAKSLGQNFLVNEGICQKIIDAAGTDKNKNVLEIGPGVGVLTKRLCENSKKVLAIEIDSRLIDILAETLKEHDNFKVINEDILKIDLKKIWKEEFDCENFIVCSNLPYNITSAVIVKLLNEGKATGLDTIVLMLQKETAERLCSKPGNRKCGAISVLVDYYCESKLCFKVSRGSFIPQPNVDSMVIKMKLRKEPIATLKDESTLFKISRAAFCARRKNILNSLSMGLQQDKQKTINLLNSCNIKVNARAEELKMEDFINLANKFYEEENKNG